MSNDHQKGISSMGSHPWYVYFILFFLLPPSWTKRTQQWPMMVNGDQCKHTTTNKGPQHLKNANTGQQQPMQANNSQ
jgi:hypothetical protein